MDDLSKLLLQFLLTLVGSTFGGVLVQLAPQRRERKIAYHKAIGKMHELGNFRASLKHHIHEWSDEEKENWEQKRQEWHTWLDSVKGILSQNQYRDINYMSKYRLQLIDGIGTDINQHLAVIHRMEPDLTPRDLAWYVKSLKRFPRRSLFYLKKKISIIITTWRNTRF